jgi:hypothetical protein
MKIEITRMFVNTKPDAKALAFFSFGIWFRNDRPKAELEINDCMILKSKDAGGDPWIAFPSKVNESNGKRSAIVWIDDPAMKEKIATLALERYAKEAPKTPDKIQQIESAFDDDDTLPF